jgi:hypothetical protein
MSPLDPRSTSRRELLRAAGAGLAGAGLAPLLRGQETRPLLADGLHHSSRAKRIVYLFQSGGPSQSCPRAFAAGSG